MALTIVAALLTFAASSLAAPSHTQRPCTDIQIPVAVNAVNQKWDAPRVDNDIDAVAFVQDIETWSSPNITQRLEGNIQVKKTLSISARLCVPEKGKKKNTLQIATHGGGFSKSYEDSACTS